MQPSDLARGAQASGGAMMLKSLATLALLGAVVATPAAPTPPPAAAAQDGAPAYEVAFFTQDTCPDGWSPAADARGRVLVGAASGAAVGATVNPPLADQEDRTHVHAWTATLTLAGKNIAAADGSNNQGAAAQAYPLAATTPPGTSGLPFRQLLVCERAP